MMWQGVECRGSAIFSYDVRILWTVSYDSMTRISLHCTARCVSRFVCHVEVRSKKERAENLFAIRDCWNREKLANFDKKANGKPHLKRRKLSLLNVHYYFIMINFRCESHWRQQFLLTQCRVTEMIIINGSKAERYVADLSTSTARHIRCVADVIFHILFAGCGRRHKSTYDDANELIEWMVVLLLQACSLRLTTLSIEYPRTCQMAHTHTQSDISVIRCGGSGGDVSFHSGRPRCTKCEKTVYRGDTPHTPSHTQTH